MKNPSVKKKMILIIATLIIFIFVNLSAQSGYPKYEFRGAWIATVVNLDWPSSPTQSVSAQKSALINTLDDLQACGINAVVFQIRPECDALYQSEIEPWSYYLTGQQGKAPNPLYDPLKFVIAEAHQRGMELHAWFNPYRAVRSVGTYLISSEHVSVKHPDWILTVGSLKILNPGLQEVRDYVTSVIKDVVERYDIDAVHFDDYFYPYEGIGSLDAATFASYPRGFANIDDWRRDNVNIFVAQIDSVIKSTKPWVKLGISPFGIWKSGTPAGVTGLSSYSAIYCDPIAWLAAGTVDYITPQCYWKIGGNQDYSKLASWWATQANLYDRHLYVGEIYGSSYTNAELPNQIKINRATDGIQGNIIFRSAFVSSNTYGFADSMQNDLFKYPAITPQMAWRDSISPEFPDNIQYRKLATQGFGLAWDKPVLSADGDSARRYVIYRFDSENITASDLDEPANILAQTYSEEYELPIPDESGTKYFVVTALDANSNESQTGEFFMISPSQIPQPVAPENYTANQRDTVQLSWRPNSVDCAYEVKISPDSLFSSDNTRTFTEVSDTCLTVSELTGMETYYWQVKAANAGGWSDYSEYFSFSTSFPETPNLVSPAHNSTEMPHSLTLVWNKSPHAAEYRLQVAKNSSYLANYMVLDTCALTDTTFYLPDLSASKYHYWRVKATNDYGTTVWSDSYRFKTAASDGLAGLEATPFEYRLGHNYPNPFNATTNIEFCLEKGSQVIINIFDLSGVTVATLVNQHMEKGYHNILFNGSGLPSGFYLYQIQAGKFIQTKKMVLLK